MKTTYLKDLPEPPKNDGAMLLTQEERRQAARLLRRAMDHSCEALHFQRRSYETKSADTQARFEQRSFTHELALGQVLHELADLLGVDVETRKEKK